MPIFELATRRVDIEQREYPVGYRFPPTKSGIVWVVTDIERNDDRVIHHCRLDTVQRERRSSGRNGVS